MDVKFKSQHEVFGEQNLVYQSDDMQVYRVSGDIDIEQLRSLSGGSEELTQNSDWRIARQLEGMKEDLAMVTPARVQVLEQKLEHWEEVTSRLRAAEEQLKQQEQLYSRLQTIKDIIGEQEKLTVLLKAMEGRLEQQEKLASRLILPLRFWFRGWNKMGEAIRCQETEVKVHNLEETLDSINAEMKKLQEKGLTNKIADRVRAVEEKIRVLDTLGIGVETEGKRLNDLQDVKLELQQLKDFCSYLYALVNPLGSNQEFNLTTYRRTTGG